MCISLDQIAITVLANAESAALIISIDPIFVLDNNIGELSNQLVRTA